MLQYGAIQVLRNTIFLQIGPHPPPRNVNNIEHYTFVTLFPENRTPPHPHLRYVTLEWSLTAAEGYWDFLWGIVPVRCLSSAIFCHFENF